MNQKEIRELIEFLVEKDIAEFEMERGDLKLHIKRGGPAQPAPAVSPVHAVPVSPLPGTPFSSSSLQPAGNGDSASVAARPPSGPAAEAPAETDLFVLKSPIVGTYYEAPSPGTPPFVKVGDVVSEGQVLCIIEAMKLMNEIEADVSGEIAKMFIPNGSPVEYGMPLFGIRRK
jgi:acetyl-CoA carboxylase biotin carboxyl carrier protein